MKTWRPVLQKVFLVLLPVLGITASHSQVLAQEIMPLSIHALQDLRFGILAKVGPAEGWAQIQPATGSMNVSGDVVSIGGFHGPAEFEVTGQPGAIFTIALPNHLRITTGLRLRDFRSEPESSGTLGPDGRAILHVGAALNVKRNAAYGQHATLFSVQVDYM